MTTATREKIIGDPVDRVDGPLKMTGAALYPSDFTFPDLTHAVLVQSTIAAGTIRGIDAAKAEATPGVLAVITHENAPALVEAQVTPLGPSPVFPAEGQPDSAPGPACGRRGGADARTGGRRGATGRDGLRRGCSGTEYRRSPCPGIAQS